MTTEKQIFALLDKLAESGEEIPSLRKIREEIGSGSLTTISNAVHNWRCINQVSGKPDANLNFPEVLSDQNLKLLCESIWNGFRPLLNAKLAAQRAALGAEIRDAKEALREARRSLESVQCKVTELEVRNQQLQQELREAQEARARAEGAYEALMRMTDK